MSEVISIVRIGDQHVVITGAADVSYLQGLITKLELQLAERTAERDQIAEAVEWTLAVAELTGQSLVDYVRDVVKALEISKENAAHNWQMGNRYRNERDAARDDLRACAGTLNDIGGRIDLGDKTLCALMTLQERRIFQIAQDVLSRPGVQAALREKG